jgi:hypothetical protein
MIHVQHHIRSLLSPRAWTQRNGKRWHRGARYWPAEKTNLQCKCGADLLILQTCPDTNITGLRALQEPEGSVRWRHPEVLCLSSGKRGMSLCREKDTRPRKKVRWLRRDRIVWLIPRRLTSLSKQHIKQLEERLRGVESALKGVAPNEEHSAVSCRVAPACYCYGTRSPD